MYEAQLSREHCLERHVKELTREARDHIADAILQGKGYRVCGLVWDFRSTIEQIIEHGESKDLADLLHAVTAASTSLSREDAVSDLLYWLRGRVEEHIPERLVEDLARDLDREQLAPEHDEIAHKDRLLKEGR